MIMTRTVRKNNNQLYFSIPKDIAKLKNIDENDVLQIQILKIYKNK